MSLPFRIRSLAALAALGTLIAMPTAAAPAQAADRRAASLTCSLTTYSRQPVTFRPPLRLRRQQVTAQGALRLAGCTSPNRSQRGVSSGSMQLRGSAQAGCTGTRRLRGSAVITWYDSRGRRAGTSALAPSSAGTSSMTDSLLTGSVTSGRLAGHRARGGLTPTGNLSGCATRGLRSVQGTGRITIA